MREDSYDSLLILPPKQESKPQTDLRLQFHTYSLHPADLLRMRQPAYAKRGAGGKSLGFTLHGGLTRVSYEVITFFSTW